MEECRSAGGDWDNWERLTPGGYTPDRRAKFYRRTEHAPHEIVCCPFMPKEVAFTFQLTDAELDALARKSEKVKELVEAARLVNDLYRTVALNAALTPFEDADAPLEK